jgi:hypothetical protein
MQTYKPEQLWGGWEAEPVNFGGMNNQTLVFMPGGEGSFHEMGLGYSCFMPMKWSLNRNALNVKLENLCFIDHDISISGEPVEVRGLGGEVGQFVELDTGSEKWYKTCDDPGEMMNVLRSIDEGGD